ncbi:adenylate/guanylate cyclase domain-containing protein [Maribacter flavus]|uniref:Guanylate cyclase domain-containing protein n=1 Tax=Maribacter flavus TaxID=1658664 RepID=A0A5B2TPJ5_9FLAO|nr:adenylate/guanylate cyclase domain-containing protein [Maribacter flavus]KAA2215748.1 hypothetical protein F0361_16260 [Maribacter flavus]
MANLRMIQRLNEAYGKQSVIRNLDLDSRSLNESFSSALSRKFRNLGQGNLYTHHFQNRMPADLAFLFIDICSFSTRFSHLDGNGIANILDQYYQIVIPIIYKYNGEIDKIIGDGIICVFGPPFYEGNANQCIKQADLCAKEIISKTNSTIFYSKVALHFGTIVYYNNTSVHYEEYTVVGKPVTELFRLEGVSVDKRVNYYSGVSKIDYYNIGLYEFGWQVLGPFSTGSLKGVSYTAFKTKHKI